MDTRDGWSQLGEALEQMHALPADVASAVEEQGVAVEEHGGEIKEMKEKLEFGEFTYMDKRVLPGIRSTLGNIYEYLLKVTERLNRIEAKVDRVEAKVDELMKPRWVDAGPVKPRKLEDLP